MRVTTVSAMVAVVWAFSLTLTGADAKRCKFPDRLDDGSWNCDRDMTECTMECEFGFQNAESSTISCDTRKGKWRKYRERDYECTEIECTELKWTENGEWDCEGNEVDDDCDYFCDDQDTHRRAQNSPSRVKCKLGGVWQDKDTGVNNADRNAKCVRYVCDEPLAPRASFGEWQCRGLTAGQKCSFVCDDMSEYRVKSGSVSSITCEEENKWSGGGRASGAEALAMCERFVCDEPEAHSDSFGYWACRDGLAEGKECAFVCEDPSEYRVAESDAGTITCQLGNRWASTLRDSGAEGLGRCERFVCDLPDDFETGEWRCDVEQPQVGQSCKIACPVRWEPAEDSSTFVTCMEGNRWGPTEGDVARGRCVEMKCNVADAVLPGSPTDRGTQQTCSAPNSNVAALATLVALSLESTCTWTCRDGLQPVSPSESDVLVATCQFTGSGEAHWTGLRDFRCRGEAVPCSCTPWVTTACSASCGGGVVTSKRTCTEAVWGGACDEDTTDVTRSEPCNEQACPRDCTCTPWSEGECVPKCGIEGQLVATRECTKEEAGGRCDIEDFAVRRKKIGTCDDLPPCPVNCFCGDWEDVAACTLSCGGGVRVQTRKCTDKAHGGTCSLPEPLQRQRELPCNEQACPDPIPCSCTPWVEGPCSAPCGGGQLTRTRQCTEGQHGGQETCSIPDFGVLSHEVTCNTESCAEPADCKCTEWAFVPGSSCSKSCGLGSRAQQRVCTPARNGGKCDFATWGDIRLVFRDVDCNERECPVECACTEWEFGDCSVSCGPGVISETRTCTPAAHGGECNVRDFAVTSRELPCNLEECPKVDCSCTAWKGDAAALCTNACGKRGNFTRTRTCEPAANGGNCDIDISNTAETVECPVKPCGTECYCEAWAPKGSCSKSCGGGVQALARACHAAQNGGVCEVPDFGKTADAEPCNEQPCPDPVDCECEKFVDAGICTKTCNGGTLRQVRECRPAQHGGKCTVADFDVRERSMPCNEGPCSEPLDCVCSPWIARTVLDGIDASGRSACRARKVNDQGEAVEVSCGDGKGAEEAVRQCQPAQNGGACLEDLALVSKQVSCTLSQCSAKSGGSDGTTSQVDGDKTGGTGGAGDKAADAGSGGSIVPVVAGIVGGLLLVALVAIFVVAAKRRKRGHAHLQKNHSADELVDNQLFHGNDDIYAGMAGAGDDDIYADGGGAPLYESNYEAPQDKASPLYESSYEAPQDKTSPLYESSYAEAQDSRASAADADIYEVYNAPQDQDDDDVDVYDTAAT